MSFLNGIDVFMGIGAASAIPLLRNSAEILLQRVPSAHEQDLKNAIGDVMEIKG
ncbi:hypothetical protein CCACVL1_27503, partial [Corchorus capsularis]